MTAVHDLLSIPTEAMLGHVSDYLFARPSFVSGAARTLDLLGVYDWYNYSRTPEEADLIAIYQDWVSVGNDLRAAIDEESEKESSPE